MLTYPKDSRFNNDIKQNNFTVSWHIINTYVLASIFLLSVSFGCGRPDNSATQSITSSDTPEGDSALEVTPAVIDLGSSRLRTYSRQLRIHNKSDTPICIISIDKSCGCITSSIKLPLHVPAFDTIDVDVGFEFATTSRGLVSQSLKLNTDDPHHPSYQIRVAGNLEADPEVKVQPEFIHFGSICIWDQPTREVMVYYSGASDLSVSSIATSDPLLNVQFVRKEPGGSVFRLSLARGRKTGAFTENVTFVTQYGQIILIVDGENEGELFATPKLFYCKTNELPILRTVMLHYSPDQDIGKLSVTSSDLLVDIVSSTTVKPGLSRVEVRVVSQAIKSTDLNHFQLRSDQIDQSLQFDVYLTN